MSSTPTIAPETVNPIPMTCGAVTLVSKEGYAAHFAGSDVVINAAQGAFGLPIVAGGAIGAPVVLAGPGSVVPVIVDEAVTQGAELTTNGSGKWEAAASADVVTAIALESSTADGDFIRALVIGRYVKA